MAILMATRLPSELLFIKFHACKVFIFINFLVTPSASGLGRKSEPDKDPFTVKLWASTLVGGRGGTTMEVTTPNVLSPQAHPPTFCRLWPSVKILIKLKELNDS